ncbi:F-box only protein 13-like [Lolium perenne]|uniref:F-box only protein 13-like n=1 Tax=Lolium perenne TaxID=4522 RepID=UPI0021F5F785|nr:F-box only protein 13-like [Lolium perenne]
MPVAASGGLVLCRAPAIVSNPLTGVSRVLPTPPQNQGVPQLHAIAMYNSLYSVALFTGEVPDMSMSVFDSSKDSWEGHVALKRSSETSSTEAPAEGGDSNNCTIYFLRKSGEA